MASIVPTEGAVTGVLGTERAVGARLLAALAATGGIRSVVLFLATAVAYAVLARIALFFVLQPQGVAAIWPAAGIGVGALLVTRAARWPVILAGIAAGVTVTNLGAGTGTATTAAFALANTVEPLVAALALRRVGFTSLATLRGVGLFLAIGVVGGPAVAGTIGAVAVAIGSDAPLLPAYVTWIFSNAGGVLTIAPLILVFASSSAPGQSNMWRAVEATGQGILLVGMSAAAFLLPLPVGVQMAAYPVFVLLVVAALRFGLQGAALSTSALAVIASAGTLAGNGPIAHLNANPVIQIGQAQVMIAVAFLVAFVTAAALAERRAVAEALEEQMASAADRAAINERVTAFAREISTSLDPDSVFQRIVQAAVDVVPADIAQLTVVGGGGPSHRVVAAIGAPGLIGRIIEPGDGVTGGVIRDGVSATVDRLDAADRTIGARDVVQDGPIALACAPVIVKESVAATIGLARLDLDRPFSADELRALEMMCGLTGVAMTNAIEFGRAQDQSIRDDLTGLPNRRYFAASFDQLSAQRLRQPPDARFPVSAILFDLDHFGSVNNERGHETGDRVLAEFGRVLAARLRRADVVARYGGEEFIALLLGTEREATIAIADEIRAAFERSSIIGADGDPIRCTVSAGVATTLPDEPSLESLIPTADVALSMAKRAGRNTVASA